MDCGSGYRIKVIGERSELVWLKGSGMNYSSGHDEWNGALIIVFTILRLGRIL